MSEHGITLDPPPGYVESPGRGTFSRHNGPFFFKHEGEDFRLGFRVLERHCNSYGIVHGGMVMTFADRLLATAVAMHAPKRMLTVRITADFIGMARVGDWIEGRGRVTRAGRSLVFVEGSGNVLRGRAVFTASGIFKVFERRRAVMSVS